MSTALTSPTIATQTVAAAETQGGFRWAVSDTVEMVKRNLRHIPRSPELLLDVTVQPVIFVVLFVYIFGGAINTPGMSYVNYLMAGIFVQTLIFACMTSGIGLAYDLQKGLVDRFRSLPMSRSAVVAGRTITDLLRGMLAVTIMFLVGLAVGFRPEGNALDWLIGIGLLLLFAFAFSWIGVTIGLLVGTPEAVQAALFVFVFPLTFASSAFVPVDTMPSWLQGFAENQPLSRVIDMLRNVFLGQPYREDALYTLGWSVLLLAIFFPIAIALYKKRTTE
ncbi:MAG TPA: ABC transporter permease [Thermomicrobiales bacterium]|nr:ABC transporter permease [Thermomicrobiales bacterium]